MTRSPDNRLSLGMSQVKFHCHKKSGIRCKSQFGQILSLQMQFDSLM